ncbi:MAG: patatin-like phospholipase family protein [Gammaproteobacteria bacterium]
MRLLARAIALLIFCSALQACVSVPQRNPVPEALVDQAEVVNTAGVRFWADAVPEDIEERVLRLRRQFAGSGIVQPGEELNLLSISGGGANGAFGAGLLKGWTESGTRPDFMIVTGISTGALIAPFAFLGSDYDDDLEALYTGIKTSDLMKRRRLIAGLMSDAIADTQPLRELLIEHVDTEMIDAIAAEHLKGRRLLIGTTNIDAKRGVIWDVSYIATKGTPESRQLIRDVMLASASIPGVFPPVRIQVEADGEEYDEMHVDGGVSRQVFLHAVPVNVQQSAWDMGLDNPRNLYVIRNAMLTPRWSAVKPKLLPVLGASISTLIRTQGMGDLYRLYLGTLRDGTVFRLASVPPDFDIEATEDFDPEYMKALFATAYELSRNGYDWKTAPPGIELSVDLPQEPSN